MNLLATIQSTAAVVFTFGLVIFLHEFGHFLVCRRLGVRVERFAFGFGPELFGVTRGATRYSVCALPLGGFVKPAGEEQDTATGAPDEYFSQSWIARLKIVAAGPVMNYVLAFLVFSSLSYLKGIPAPSTEPQIGNMLVGYPADRAGLKVGDVITTIDGKAVVTWLEMAAIIHRSAGKKIDISYKRGKSVGSTVLAPRKDSASGEGLIGILPETLYRKPGLWGSLAQGLRECWDLTAMTVKTIASKISRGQRPDLAGPVGIIQMVRHAAQSGMAQLFNLIGMLSVAIGFFNFLPIPLLDGGHAVFYLWEGISGRKPSRAALAKANGAGIAFLLFILIFATYNDVKRIAKSSAGRPPSAGQGAPQKP